MSAIPGERNTVQIAVCLQSNWVGSGGKERLEELAKRPAGEMEITGREQALIMIRVNGEL